MVYDRAKHPMLKSFIGNLTARKLNVKEVREFNPDEQDIELYVRSFKVQIDTLGGFYLVYKRFETYTEYVLQISTKDVLEALEIIQNGVKQVA